jgi:hypothetical protein
MEFVNMTKQYIDLYHKLCIPDKKRSEIMGILEREGLLSHLTTGRHGEQEDEEGNCLGLPEEHRIWFQTDMKTSFDDLEKVAENHEDCLVLHTKAYELPNDVRIRRDDQYHDPSGKTVFAASDEEFVVKPSEIEVYNKGKWIPLIDTHYAKKKRTKYDMLAPWAKKEFKEVNLDPFDDVELQIYNNAECFGTSIIEECEKMKERGYEYLDCDDDENDDDENDDDENEEK